MTDLTNDLMDCYASAVHDVLVNMGHRNQILPVTLRSLKPGRKLAGEICTISGHMDQTLSRHESLLRWSRLLSKVPGGKVLMCQPNTKAIALMGELSAQVLVQKQTKGYIVDGLCRDTDFILDMDFPVFCEANTPADIVERWTYDSVGDPITIGTVTVRSGDWVLADRDGIVILPQEVAAEATAETRKIITTESDMRAAILDGMDPEAAYLKFGKF